MAHKLLLADDSVTIQRVIELTFADEDIELTAVGDGRQAIECIDADPPDIVLADVGMPEKDGYEVAAHVKNNPRLAHIPVLLLTGAFEPVDEERARAAGCDGVLAKPFEPQMVIARVKELLAGAARRVPGPRTALPAGIPATAPGPATAAPAVLDAPVPEPARNALPETVAMSAGEMLAELNAMTLPVPSAPVAADAMPPEPSASEGAPEAEPALDGPLKIRRRQTMAVQELAMPPAPLAAPPAAPEPVRQAALDEYFERLDAAFTNLQSAPSASPPPATVEPNWTPPASVPRSPDPFARDEPPRATPVADSPFGSARRDQAPGGEAVDAPGRPAIAQAFSALLAAERGESDSGHLQSWFAQAPSPALDVDEVVDRVTRQVLEQMSDRVVRDAVTDIVSRVAERLVREEIDRIKASIA